MKLPIAYVRSYLPGKRPIGEAMLHVDDFALYPERKWIPAVRGFSAGLTANPGRNLLMAGECDERLGAMSTYNRGMSKLLCRKFYGIGHIQLTDPVELDAWPIRGFDEMYRLIQSGDPELTEMTKDMGFVSHNAGNGVCFYMVQRFEGAVHDKNFTFLKLRFG